VSVVDVAAIIIQLLCVSDDAAGASHSLNATLNSTTGVHVTRVRVKDARSQMMTRRNVAKMLIAVVVMFGVCFLPVHLLNILRSSIFLPRNARASLRGRKC